MEPEKDTIMFAAWPQYEESLHFAAEEEEVERMKEAIRGIRNVRSQMNVPPKQKAQVIVVSANEKVQDIFRRGGSFLAPLAFATQVSVQADRGGIPDSAVSIPIQDGTVFIPLEQLVDLAKERERLEKEKARLEGEIARVEKKLANAGFVAKAPAQVVEAEKAKGEKYRSLLEQVNENLNNLG